jgi:hypothetical protein
MSMRRRKRVAPWVFGIAALLVGSALAAQQRRYGGGGEGRYNEPIRSGLPEKRNGFMFCRLQYEYVLRFQSGYGWSTDYPRADQNFMTRLPQLTGAGVASWNNGDIGNAVVRATDPNLFKCPFLFTSDPGSAGFSNDEVVALREYLLKGGFLWVDDFWGQEAWAHWAGEILRVLPEYSIQDLKPDHPLYSSFYQLLEVPQIPSIQSWYETGSTHERWFEPDDPHLRAISDENGRILVLMTHNTDIADGWERETDNEDFFYAFTAKAYGVGINVAVWVMSH